MELLPSYFSYKREVGEEASNLFSFSYDRDQKLFLIDDKSVQLADFDPYTFVPDNFDLDWDGMPIGKIRDYPAMLPVTGAIITGPKLHEWTQANPDQVSQASEVMKEVFVAIADPKVVEVVEDMEESEGIFGFISGSREDGGVHLQVFGNCSCMGPDPDGLFVNDPFVEHGFAEYSLHNADSQEQRASLYAGLGHLAALAGGTG